MSGIAGALVFNEGFEPSELIEKVTFAMQHRARDGIFSWSGQAAALGLCLLDFNKKEREQTLPLLESQSNLVIVFDGRIDNRSELVSALKNSWISLKISDSFLVLEAYKKWGSGCLLRLLGDFAFAIWDISKRKLFCARDPLGARPFCFVKNPNFFAFASEPEALLKLPGISSDPNELDIAVLLVPGFENLTSDRAWNKEVVVLSEGSWLEVEQTGYQRSFKYWQLENSVQSTHRRDEEVYEEFLSLFKTAVSDRFESNPDSAVMMSGGIDSVSIAVAACSQQPIHELEKIHTFSAVDEDPECIESQCIKSMGLVLGLEQHLLNISALKGNVNESDLSEAAWEFAHPVDNSLLLPAMMCLNASRSGKSHLIHGVCGDLAIHAPTYYPSGYIQAGKFGTAWSECNRASKNNVYLNGIAPFKIFVRSSLVALRSVRGVLGAHFLRSTKNQANYDFSKIDAGFAHSIDLKDRIREQQKCLNGKDRDGRNLEDIKFRLRLMNSGLAGYGRVAARYGMEVSDPWADRRVLEFLLTLPLNYRVRDGWGKYLPRAVFQHQLPPQVCWRKDKTHLGWKFASKALSLRPEYVDRVFSTHVENQEEIGHYVSQEYLKRLERACRLEHNEEARDEMFGMMTLLVWLKRLRNQSNNSY